MCSLAVCNRDVSKIMNEFNCTKKEYDMDKTIQMLFEEQVEKTPNDIALIYKDTQLTYKQLNEKANQIARVLREKLVKPDDIVGILVKRSAEMISGIIGILKAGGAYLPLDPEYPDERIKYMLQDSNAKILLTKRTEDYRIGFEGETIHLDDSGLEKKDGSNISNTNKSCNLAYVIYTSGSTGKPKGVMIEHKSVINFITGVTSKIDFSPAKTILALTTISFDIFVLETLLPLTKGLKVVLADESDQRNPKLLNDLIIKNEIDMLQATPSRMQLLINYDNSLNIFRNLKDVMVGGEAFPKALLEKLSAFNNLKIYNMYGPTETTVWSTISDLTCCEGIDIGKPISNTQVYIIDEENRVLNIGNEGELCIAGDGVARGYLNRPELTEEKFVINPYMPKNRMYKTGDIGKWLPNGNLKCYGRIDNQVKIKGHRIELEEVETQLLSYQSVKEAAVTAREGKDGIKHLCAYIVSDKEINISDLKGYLSIKIPEYMIPTYYMRIDELPQTPNGKIDRKSLPNPQNSDTENTFLKEDVEISEAGNLKTRIKEIIRQVLELTIPARDIKDEDLLSDIGLDSVSYIQVIVAIESEFGFVTEEEFLSNNAFSTFQSMVSYVETKSSQE